MSRLPQTPVASEPRLLVLLALRLTSLAQVPALARKAGVPEPEVEALLDDLAAAGLARFREGRLSGWALTPAGRAEGERLLAAELDDTGLRGLVEDAYRRFLALNQPFLSLCTDWQQIEPGVLNDHSDPAHDAAVIDRLVEMDRGIQPVCADLAAGLARFEGYGPRFTAALEKVRSGETEWFVKPMIDSYHTVWFELHENLLATLGVDRATEVAS